MFHNVLPVGLMCLCDTSLRWPNRIVVFVERRFNSSRHSEVCDTRFFGYLRHIDHKTCGPRHVLPSFNLSQPQSVQGVPVPQR